MTEKKQIQKELKQPDQFQVEVMHLVDWLVKRKQVFIYALPPIAAIVIGIFAYQAVQEHRTDVRGQELSTIDVIFDKENESADKKRTEIQEKIAKIGEKQQPAHDAAAKAGDAALSPEAAAAKLAAEAKAPAVVVDPKVAEAEKKKLETEIRAIKADHAASLAGYQKFFDANPSNPEGWRAGMRVTNIYVEQQKYQEAATMAERLIKQAVGMDFYQVQVRLMYVSILEELERYDDGLKEIEILTKLADEGVQPRVLLTKGRLEILKNNKTEANVTFAALIAKHGTSAEAQKAKTIMALWN